MVSPIAHNRNDRRDAQGCHLSPTLPVLNAKLTRAKHQKQMPIVARYRTTYPSWV